MQRKRKLSQLALLLIFLAITVFINLIFNKLNICFDLTENEMYSISDKTRSITGEIGRDMNVYCFVSDKNKASVICEISRNFCKTSEKLHFKVIDPIEHPEVTKRYTSDSADITDNTVVFDNGKNYRIIPYEDMFAYNYLTGRNDLLVTEERFCIAVMALNRDATAKIAFLTGHGEAYDENLESRVVNSGAECENVDTRNEEISDFDVIMLISPKTDFTVPELEKLDAFLNNGGAIIVSLDASVPYCEMLEGFLSEWGIAVERDMVFATDTKDIMGNQPYSIIGKLKSHPVTDGLIKNNINPVFFASRSITPLWEVQGGISVNVLAESGENAYSVPLDISSGEKSGAFALLTLSQGEKGRVFTFGSNMFFSNELKAYNQDLLENIIAWSTDGELVSEVPPKIVTSSNIQVPKSDIVFWIVIFGIIIPVMIAAAGIIAAIRRKKL